MIKPENKLTFTIQELKRAEKPLRTYPYKDILERLIETYNRVEYMDDMYPLAFKKNVDFKHGLISYNHIDEKLVNWGRHSFFYGLFSAYMQHRPIVLSPDIIWQLIIQGFSYHIEFNAEKLRDKFVDFDGKMTLIIANDKISVHNEHSPWKEIFSEFAQKINETFGKDLVNTITADFSTTTETEFIASQITLMHSVESFAEFLVLIAICGIPEVTLEGTAEDWEKVLKKAENLRKYDLNWWIDALKPVLLEFIQTAKGNINLSFWKNIMTYQAEGCGFEEFDGWFVKFFPYDKDGNRLDLKTLKMQHNLPNEIVKVPVKCVEQGLSYNLEVWSGFFGLQQDEKTFALKPQIGWLIRRCDEDIQQTLKEKIDKEEELIIRVKTIPDEILALETIPGLSVNFIGKITVPEKLFTIPIKYLSLHGEISKTEIAKLRRKLPKTTVLTINGIQYPKSHLGRFIASLKKGQG